ncbi:hypothetical protein [Caballeronia sordidicola]|uniref:terminase small subunit-like protein n=1 Tax=Caballeronia sordidicola TaxID=196367 RepID=UPI0034CF4A73
MKWCNGCTRRGTKMDTNTRRNAGRSHYPDEVIDRIINEVRGGRSVKIICEDKTLPCKRTFYNLLAIDPIRQAEYVAAKRQQVLSRNA